MRYFYLPLIIGWFLGAASGLLFMHFSHSPAMHDHHMKHMREQFFKELKATPDQRVKIETILQDSRKKIETIFAQTEPQVEALRHTARNDIRALLAPEQQTTFDQLNAKMEVHFKKRFEEIHDKWH